LRKKQTMETAIRGENVINGNGKKKKKGVGEMLS
jgi:hypothetical protein